MSAYDASPSEGDRLAMALFNRHYADARRHVDAQSRVWSDLVDAYMGDTDRPKPSGDDAWRSHVFFKYAWQQVHTLAAELAADDDASFVWRPRNPRQRQYAKVCSGLVSGQLDLDDYPDKRLLSVLFAAIYGGCPVKPAWLYERDTITARDSHGRAQEIEVTVEDRPTATIIDPTDFAYDLRSRESKHWRYAYHRMRMTFSELQSPKRADGSPRYKNLDQIEAWLSGDYDAIEFWSETTKTFAHDYASEIERAKARGIEVVEMWTPKRLIVVACGGIVIRDEPNPYHHRRIPFELITITPSLDGPWGHGVMWAIRDVQELLWTLDNANMDALKLAIDPPMAGDFPEQDRRGLYPGRQFDTKAGKDGFAPIRVSGIEHFTSDGAVQGYLSRMKQGTGITDEIGGQSQADSATQAAINQRQAKGRISIMLRAVDKGWARVAERFLQLDQQFLDHTKPHRVTGLDGWEYVKPEEIAGIWEVRPKNTSERVVQELDRQNKLEALASLVPLAETITASGMAIDLAPVIRGAVEAFQFEADEVVVPLDEKLQTDARIASAQAIMQAQAMAMSMPQMAPDPAQGAPGAVAPPAEQGMSLEEEANVDPSTSTGRSAGQAAFNEQAAQGA